MAKEIDVLIFFELENRDLESAMLLEYELKRRGLSVESVQVSWTGPIGPLFYKPKLIIANSVYDDKTLHQFYDYRGALEGNRFILVNYHCEQIVTNGSLEFASTTGKARDAYHLAWGEYFQRVLLDKGIPQDLISITGSPRLDFFREEFRSFNPSKEELAKEYGLDPTKKWILALGNFSVAFLTDEQIDDYEKRGNEICRNERNISKESMDLFLEWLGEAADKVKGEEVEIIYRPHPAEPPIPAARLLESSHSNFRIIRDRPVRQWIVNSDLCFTWLSTSAVEAAVAGKPVYSIRPRDIPVGLQIPLLENVPILKSLAEVQDVVDGFLNGNIVDVDQSFMRAISASYSLRKKTAVECTADIVQELLLTQDRAIFDSHYSASYSIRKLMNYYLKIIMKRVGMLKLLPRYELLPKERTTKKVMDRVRTKIRASFD